MTREFTIERALEWTYREELPKEAATGWLAGAGPSMPGGGKILARLGVHGTVIGGRANMFGLVPDLSAASGPHPAALMLHELVCGLAALEVDLDGWSAFPDLAGLPDEAAPLLASASARGLDVTIDRRQARALPELLRLRAIVGVSAGWMLHEPPRLAAVTCPRTGRDKWFVREERAVAWDDDGEPVRFEMVETDQVWLDPKNCRRLKPGAYRKYEMRPSLDSVAIARAEWQVWRAALDVLADTITAGEWDVITDGRRCRRVWPQGIVVRPSALPSAPWLQRDTSPRLPLADQSLAGRI